ncbi:hypothetical protein Tco_1124330 [Tanacetum coccineum]|uniref:Uncharacterized protein n=1 Tax=Tanacetum coccineum TaxID=301880 RepID=A0ABQ5J7A4_9ASTR
MGVDGPPVMPEDPYAYVVAPFQAPPSPDYVPDPEYPPSTDFVPKPVYPEFMPLEDEVLPAEEQPLPTAVSPTADSPSYVPESDPKEDPEDDDDEDPEEDPTDYPANGGEEEHPAPADSTAVALPAIDQAPSAEETEPFETDESAATPPPHPTYQVTARILIRDEPPTPFWSKTKVARLLAIPTPPPSPLSLWSSPLPQIPFPPLPPILSPLPVSPPLPISSPPPATPIRPLGYRVAMIRLRANALSTSHSLPLPPPIILSHTRSDAPSSGTPPLLPIPAPTSSPPLLLPSTNHSSSAAAARPTRGSRADYGFVATMDMEIRHDPERYVGYGITDTWDEMLEDMPAVPATDDIELGRWMTEFATKVRQDTDEIYTRFTDGERKARMSREAWGRSMDASDLACSEVMSLRTTVLGQQTVITELLTADRRRQAQFIEALKLLKRLQTQMTEFERQ